MPPTERDVIKAHRGKIQGESHVFMLLDYKPREICLMGKIEEFSEL